VFKISPLNFSLLLKLLMLMLNLLQLWSRLLVKMNRLTSSRRNSGYEKHRFLSVIFDWYQLFLSYSDCYLLNS